MVHALRSVHTLLRPSAALVDIRPLDERAEFIVVDDGLEHHAGWMRETDDGIEYRQAEQAMRDALAEGLFGLEAERSFPFLHHARTFPALRAYLADIWSDALIDPAVEMEAGRLLESAGPHAEVILRETGWMRRLRALSTSP